MEAEATATTTAVAAAAATEEAAAPPPAPQDADIESVKALTADLVSRGLMSADHQQKIVQEATAAAAKVDELRSFLDGHFVQARTALFGAPPQQLPARQQLIDSVSSTVLNLNRIQTTFTLLTDAGQDAAQKVISIILGRLMAVLDDFKKHLQYQNWSVSFAGSVPPSLQVAVQITFQ
ncbi:MAG: hypothetical protein ABSF83_09690 [Nitrososphaerales archaeon]